MKEQNKPNVMAELEELRQEVRYLRKQTEQTAAKILYADALGVSIRHELEQKRRGFKLMAELAVSLREDDEQNDIFVSTAQRINAALNMQRTAVLVPDNEGLKATVLQGYSEDEKAAVEASLADLEKELPELLQGPILVTSADNETRLKNLRKVLGLPYLISTPVFAHDSVVALLVTGRIIEQEPFFPKLGHNDVDTVQSVASYLTAALTGQRLRKFENLANYDPLTQLPNRRLTMERLNRMTNQARGGDFHMAVMFIDLDGFKKVNDNFGHSAGDTVLRTVAERLKQGVREADLVGRLGGDEFIVALSRINRPDDASVVARKIIGSVAKPIEIQDATLRVSASIGIAVFPLHGDTKSALLKAADEAMYEAKHQGKNRFWFATF